ncbi:MAG: hypothetical protein HDT09_03680 [Bacteroidales bacterium]|nr:hypothetical protein [Bacteroidales bacterium]
MARQQTYRATWHDYQAPTIYMLTLTKNPEAPTFGTLCRDKQKPYNDPSAVHTYLSTLGSIVLNAIKNIASVIPDSRLLQYVIMPDHVHILLQIQKRLEQPLGYYIAHWKRSPLFPKFSFPIFTQGFNDRILRTDRSLDHIYNYIRQNPYRLIIRREHPDFFSHVRQLTLGTRKFEAYGNLFLLKNPFKAQVIVHRSDTDQQHAQNKNRWVYVAANGGVLVSPFISKREKEIRQVAEEVGGKLIVIHSNLGERFKPSEHDSDLCLKGHLLILAPAERTNDKLSREVCLTLNKFANEISNI